jgi:hypothetical protein
MSELPESLSQAILLAAIEENRASELLECMFNGGAPTIDRQTGKLVLATKEQLDSLHIVEI